MKRNLAYQKQLRRYVIFLCCVALLSLCGCAAKNPYGETFDAEALHEYASNLHVPEMQEAAKASSLQYIEVNKKKPIPVRYFPGLEDHSPVILLHGLQSHSLWFVQSSQFIARLGVPVYAMDRRGSGLSQDTRGDMANFREMVEDIDVVVEYVKEKHNSDRVHLVGHCFGAIPATLYASINPDKVKSMILPTPGIHTHSDLSLGKKLNVLLSVSTESTRYIEVPLETELFTESEPYRDFIRNDRLSLKYASATTYYSVHKARQYLKDHGDDIRAPVFMGFAGNDNISDNNGNKLFFDQLTNSKNLLKTYDKALHILEFSKDKDLFFSDLREWFRNVGELN